MHFVGDGGALNGGCSICGDDDPVHNDVMLDPDQVAHLKGLEHVSCKYILSLLVHKDNKDISSQPATLPAGPKSKDIREAKRRLVEK